MMDVATLRAMLGKKLLTPGSGRNAVAWAIEEKNYSQRRACRLVGVAPRVYRYRSRRPDDAGLRNRLRKLAERRRFGYRRLHLCGGWHGRARGLFPSCRPVRKLSVR